MLLPVGDMLTKSWNAGEQRGLWGLWPVYKCQGHSCEAVVVVSLAHIVRQGLASCKMAADSNWLIASQSVAGLVETSTMASRACLA